MKLLEEGIAKGLVQKTQLTRKLTIDGITDAYPVYRVKLDCLYFNDRNDRIATYISKYKAEHNVDNINRDNVEEYNEIIHEFIKLSNLEAFKKTKNNIGIMDQREPGVVLNDGRIIDGNRRFTCLRELSKDDLRFGHFETVILDRSIENYEKQIKMLELMIQIGEEAKTDYNPIERLAGIYNDVIKNKLLTEKEYAMSTNQKENEIRKEVEVAALLEEFLEFINAPEKFYIARELELDGPLRELYLILKKIKDENRKENIKNVVFTNLLMAPSSDMTRYVRKIKSVVNTRHEEEFIEKSLDAAEEIIDELSDEDEVNRDVIAKVRSNEKNKEKLEKATETATTKIHVEETRNRPALNLEKVIDILDSVDTNIFMKLSEDQKSEIKSLCEKAEAKILSMKEELNV